MSRVTVLQECLVTAKDNTICYGIACLAFAFFALISMVGVAGNQVATSLVITLCTIFSAMFSTFFSVLFFNGVGVCRSLSRELFQEEIVEKLKSVNYSASAN